MNLKYNKPTRIQTLIFHLDFLSKLLGFLLLSLLLLFEMSVIVKMFYPDSSPYLPGEASPLPLPSTPSAPSSTPSAPPSTPPILPPTPSTPETTNTNTDPLKGKVNLPWSKTTAIPGVGLTDWNAWIFECIHCAHTIEIEQNQINCKIFRDAVWKTNGEIVHSETKEKMSMVQGQFVPPHLSKSWCEEVVRQNVVFGCGKPFTFDGVTAPVACEYI